MPAKRSLDPLVTLPFRVPLSVRDELTKEATQADCTVSDVLRKRLRLTNAPPLEQKPPRRRKSHELGAVSMTDPVLIRQLAAIGSNLNQLARKVNAGHISGTPIDGAALLVCLLSIDRSVEALAQGAKGKSDAH
jgi:Bacterial mobilisation protein (MobC)